jgi:hypothetical protein
VKLNSKHWCYAPFLLSFQIVVGFSAVAFGQANWKLTKDTQGIQVFAREKPNSPFLQIKAVATFNAEPEDILPFLADVEGQKNWVAECKASSIVGSKSSPWDLFVYNQISIPWPFEDRDTVFRSKIRKLSENKGFAVFLRSVGEPAGPSSQNSVRAKSFEGQWLLERLPNKSGTLVDFRIHLDPGGNLTSVFVNNTATRLQFKTLSNLRDRLKENKPGLLAGEVPELGPIDPSVENP